uniref:Cytochrome c oxidase subunit 2 n=1 Tax=Ruizia karukerae TaxID=2201929 RepID=A0A343YNB0_9BILA|nr:cytochrome c oxidase subunit II [Ruizia karukerae]
MDSFFNVWMMLYSFSLISSYMDWFHNFNYSLLLGVLFFVLFIFVYLLGGIMFCKNKKVEYHMGELFCSLLPVLILVFQMIPSLSLLYYYGLMNMSSSLSLKVTGHQWYWDYEYGSLGVYFDSYMKSLDELSAGDFRLLEVDNRCMVPYDMNVCVVFSSADVIHSWAIPSLFIKMDSMSGVLSTLFYKFSILGVYYGQCSEICGVNHSFMPIVVEVGGMSSFLNWVNLMV